MRCRFLAIITLSYTPLIYAQQTLYEGEHGELSAGVQIQTATLMEGNNRSGGAIKQNLSASFQRWSVETMRLIYDPTL